LEEKQEYVMQCQCNTPCGAASLKCKQQQSLRAAMAVQWPQQRLPALMVVQSVIYNTFKKHSVHAFSLGGLHDCRRLA
jgi:hypothetical protein